MDPYRGEQYHRQILTAGNRQRHREHINRSLRQHGAEVVRELERVLSTGSRSGRIYIYRGRAYQASAPGEPPAKRSGRLASSNEYNARQFELVIGNTAFSDRGAPYPLYLEKGTSRMDPRPYWVSTIERLHMDLYRELQNGLVLA